MSLTQNIEEGEQETVDGDSVTVARPDKVAPVIDEWTMVYGSVTIEQDCIRMHDRFDAFLSVGTSTPTAVKSEDNPEIVELYLRGRPGADDRESTTRLDAEKARGLYQAIGKALKIHGELPGSDSDAE